MQLSVFSILVLLHETGAEIKKNECVNGTCIDEINSYHCQCTPGFEGKYCSEEIDECLIFMPCENGGTCKDKIADYECKCPPEYGGKNCSIELLGCRKNLCTNGATCRPFLNKDGHHQYRCHCPLGFHGDYCNITTTVSFGSINQVSFNSNYPMYWELPTKRSNIFQQYELAFQFRTTLPSGFLAKGISSESSYLLYLKDSSVHLSIYKNSVLIVTISSQMGLNDAEWKDVMLIIKHHIIILNVNDEMKQENVTFNDINFDSTLIGSQHSSFQTSISNMSGVEDFVGCIREVKLGNQLLIPQSNTSGLFRGRIGCDRTKQCNSNTCYNSGKCMDLWYAHSCNCQRSFFGVKCQYTYSPATFGVNNTIAWAKVEIPKNDSDEMKHFVDVGLVFRTRKDNGLLFDFTTDRTVFGHYSETYPSYLRAFIQNSKLHVVIELSDGSSSNATTIVMEEKVDDGEYHFLKVQRNRSLFFVALNDSDKNSVVPSDSVLDSNLLVIGSHPPSPHLRTKRQVIHNNLMDNPQRTRQIIESNEIGNGSFKGVIKDMKVNDKSVSFFPLDVSNTTQLPETLNSTNSNVQEGIISDDPCNVYSPCQNNAECVDIWNEYWCNCSTDYRGKNCSELQPCSAKQDCPPKSTCHNLPNGYECVAAAAFNGSSRMLFASNFSTNITNITFLYTTLDPGILFSIDNGDTFFTIAVNYSMLLRWKNHNSSTNETYFGENMADGKQHKINLSFSGENIMALSDSVVYNLTYSNVLFDNAINIGTNVTVAQSIENDFKDYKGCIEELRINGVLLPFVSHSYVIDSKFLLKENFSEVGCVLCWNNDCANNRYCEARESSFNCSCGGGYKGRYCETDICVDENPCKHNGRCSHDRNDIKCDCGPDYEGKLCDTMIDHCRSQPCQNSGTCHDLKPGFNCTCAEHFEGTLCEISKVKNCKSKPCKNGGSCYDNDTDLNSIMFTCYCLPGFTGVRCENKINFCQSSPCNNGGTCISDSLQATYHCNCPEGYAGKNCEERINACASNPCKNGRCEPLIVSYSCFCNYGYMGNNCENKITSCDQKTNLCNNGNCTNINNSYNCNCYDGYHGRHCVLTDLCYTVNPCERNEKCIRMGNEDTNYTYYKCECSEGECEIPAVAGTDYGIIIGAIVGCIFFLSIFIAVVMFLRVAKKKRATRGTYSPSRQEMYGSRVEMNHVMKPPPEERLI